MGNAVEDESSQDDEEQNRSSERSPIIFGAPWVGPPAVVAARRATPVFKAWVCHSRTAFTSPRNCRELFGERREEFHDVEERPLLLDHRINRDVLECDCSRHGHAFLNLVKDAANVSDVACLSIARVFQGRGRTDILGPVCTENTVRVDYLTDSPMPRSRSVSPLLWGLSASSICCETKS